MSMYRYFTPPNLWMDGATAASAFVLLMADFLRPPFVRGGTQAGSASDRDGEPGSVEQQGSVHER